MSIPRYGNYRFGQTTNKIIKSIKYKCILIKFIERERVCDVVNVF